MPLDRRKRYASSFGQAYYNLFKGQPVEFFEQLDSPRFAGNEVGKIPVSSPVHALEDLCMAVAWNRFVRFLYPALHHDHRPPGFRDFHMVEEVMDPCTIREFNLDPLRLLVTGKTLPQCPVQRNPYFHP